MRVRLQHPNGANWTLDLPGATREDCDLLARWIAHILTPEDVRGWSAIPITYQLEIS